MEGEIGFARPDQAVPPGRLDLDPATNPSPGGVDTGSASSIDGIEIDGTLGSSKGPITGRTRIRSIRREAVEAMELVEQRAGLSLP